MAIKIKFPSIFIGYLLASKDEKIVNEKFLSIKGLSFEGVIAGLEGWESFTYKSNKPLLGEDELDLQGPYFYPIISRRSGLRVLLLCNGKPVIDHLLNLYSNIYQPKLIPIRFSIHEMVCDIAENPKNYVLTAVHARVDAYGNNLKATSFYGEDVGEATIFRENIELFSCFSCGIKDAKKKYELIRLSSDGIISFRLYRFVELLDIEKILGYVAENGYYIFPEGYSGYHEKELQ